MAEERIVAWVSRHKPLPAQVESLKRVLGEVRVVQVARTFRSAQEVLREIKRTGAQYAVVVLPLSMISQLLPLAKREGVTLLWAEMKPPENHPGSADTCLGPMKCPVFDKERDVWLPIQGLSHGRHLRFNRFYVIKDIRMELEPL